MQGQYSRAPTPYPCTPLSRLRGEVEGLENLLPGPLGSSREGGNMQGQNSRVPTPSLCSPLSRLRGEVEGLENLLPVPMGSSHMQGQYSRVPTPPSLCIPPV